MVRGKRPKANDVDLKAHLRHGGRPKGAKHKSTKLKELNADQRLKRIMAKSKTPLEYMLRVMNDEEVAPRRRDKMASAAARYCHPALQAITRKDGTDIPLNLSQLSDEDLRAIANAKRLLGNILGGPNEAPGGAGTGSPPPGTTIN